MDKIEELEVMVVDLRRLSDELSAIQNRLDAMRLASVAVSVGVAVRYARAAACGVEVVFERPAVGYAADGRALTMRVTPFH